MCSNYPGIKLEPALGTLEDKIEPLSSYAHVVHTTAKLVISRRRKNENVFKMSKKWKARAKRAKMLFFIVKYANLWGFCCRRRRGCLSFLLNRNHDHFIRCYEEQTLEMSASLGYPNEMFRFPSPNRPIF